MIMLSFILFATSPGQLVTREYPSKNDCLSVAETAQTINEVEGASYFCVEKAER